MTKFFIHHPVFAWVLAIVVMLGGVFALNNLAISQYPSIAPTTVRIQATYTGASAKTIENSVTKQIESQMTGLDGLLYMTSQSSQGSASISLVFDTSLSPELAQVEVQNKLSNVEAKLPSAVQQAGLRVSHSSNSILLIAALVSTDAKYDSVALGEILSTQLEEPIERTSGVGDVNVFSQPYAMRIWLDPTKLYKYQLTPASVVDAVSVQNTNVSAGYIGDQPVVQGQQIEVPLTAQSMLTSVDDFKRIVLKTNSDGSSVYVGDVARVELGAQSADVGSRFNGHPAAGIAVNLAAGANAVDTSLAVRATIASLTSSLPPGVEVAYPYDTAPFVQDSINDVYKTLFIAIALVFLVILVFLQSWRATIIPTIAVPIVLLGTFGILELMGMSINTLTMFALVLAIGLLVDDAIVVVENVERVMDEENISALAATEKSMSELSSALIGIVLVLSAVFLPMAFMSGSTGVIYRQFSVTIISAMVLSLFVALILTPTMCARLLKPGTSHPRFAPARWFNKGFDGTQTGYVATVRRLVRRPLRVAMVIFAVGGGVFLAYGKVPNSFLPTEDQGVLMVMVELPEGSTKQATTRVIEDIEGYLVKDNSQYVTSAFASLGFSFSGSGQNEAMIFAKLKPYAERKGMSAGMIAAAGNRRYGTGQLGQVIFAQPPSIPGLGTSSGFTMELVDQSGTGTDALAAAAKELSAEVKTSPDITGLRGADAATTPSLKIVIDPEKAQAYGISLSDINSQLSTIFAGDYVNDFIMGTKLHEVIVQGDAPYRMQPQDIGRWFTKNSNSEMVPYDAFTSLKWQLEPKLVREYGSTEAIELQGDAAPGVSSGQAMDTIQRLAEALPGHYGVAWTGLSYQQVVSGNQETLLYGLSGLVVFLCLAALYESWTVPFSVMLAVPVGVLGALLAAWLFGQANDVYFKVGMLTTIGLSARNAILIVEFAQTLRKTGLSLTEAAVTASRLRLRPILMTSFAFALGILPLALASGAGSASQNSIGIGMLGGVLFTALFGTFLSPAFYVAVMVIVDRFHRSPVELAK